MVPKLFKILRNTTIFYTNVAAVKIYMEMEQIVEEFVEPMDYYFRDDFDDNFTLCDTEYKNFDNLDTRKRVNIIFLCTDLTDRGKCKHIVDAALALKACGHKITIVTCAYLDNVYNQDLSEIKFILYKFDMAQQHRPASDVRFLNTWFLKSSLQNADEILVPNKIFSGIYQRFCSPEKPHLMVCQPHIDVRQLKSEKLITMQEILENIREASYIYLVLGEYHKTSNFELIIEAFHMLLLNLHHNVHNKLHLVISGHCSRSNRHHAQYYRYLQRKVHDHRLLDRVTFSRRLDKCHKKTLMTNAIAILDPAVDVLFNRYLLEAMALRRPIIATDTGFAEEVLVHGTSAYLVPPTAEHFSAAMADILVNKQNGEFIANLAYREFQKTYSFEAYGKRLNDLVYKYCDKRKNTKILSRT
ncbi:ALG2 alpha-13/16-mannosyltransferase [Carabus blaptoides fortunei]